jgi:hypothetical protein
LLNKLIEDMQEALTMKGTIKLKEEKATYLRTLTTGQEIRDHLNMLINLTTLRGEKRFQSQENNCIDTMRKNTDPILFQI